jgi:hypothetical protein
MSEYKLAIHDETEMTTNSNNYELDIATKYVPAESELPEKYYRYEYKLAA